MPNTSTCTGSCFFWFNGGQWLSQNHCSGDGCDCATPTQPGEEGDIAITRCVKVNPIPGSSAGGELLWTGKAIATQTVTEQWVAFSLTGQTTNGFEWEQFPELELPPEDVQRILSEFPNEPGTVAIVEMTNGKLDRIIASGRVKRTDNP